MLTRMLPAVVAAALLAGAAGPAPARAHHLECGEVVTESVTLDADLLRCPGTALVIGADGITVDLDGHLIQGVRGSFGNTGIRNPGFADVRIRDGRIADFTTGISLGRFAWVPGPAVPGNVVRRVELVDDRVGVELLAGVERATVTRNVVRGGWEAGIVVDEASGVRIHRNHLSGNHNGIRIDPGTTDTVVARNRVLANDNFGIVMGARYDGALPPVGNLLAGNVTDGNRIDGILVVGSRTTRLEGNRARGNGDDGVEVRCPDEVCAPDDVTVGDTVATGNGDLGIDADHGTGDGGGNRARRNGNGEQCVGVACS